MQGESSEGSQLVVPNLANALMNSMIGFGRGAGIKPILANIGHWGSP
jgi:hypothetical protein